MKLGEVLQNVTLRKYRELRAKRFYELLNKKTNRPFSQPPLNAENDNTVNALFQLS